MVLVGLNELWKCAPQFIPVNSRAKIKTFPVVQNRDFLHTFSSVKYEND